MDIPTSDSKNDEVLFMCKELKIRVPPKKQKISKITLLNLENVDINNLPVIISECPSSLVFETTSAPHPDEKLRQGPAGLSVEQLQQESASFSVEEVLQQPAALLNLQLWHEPPPTALLQEKTQFSGMKIALVQLAVGPDKSKNVANAVKEIHIAKEKGAQLVALPECFNSPYGTKYFNQFAEEIPSGETCRALSKAAAEAGVCVVGGTVPERCGDKLYNTCTVWDKTGKLLAKHRKVHLFDIDIPNKIRFKESDVLSAGDQITTFDYLGVKVGIGICYDLRFSEMAHIMAYQGCSLLIYPGAFNMTTGPRHWELLGRARANDLQLWVALVSPARDTSAEYVAWGHSTLVDPWANVLHKLDEKPDTLLADIDLKLVEEVRSQIPIKSQRRTDLYDTVATSKKC